MFLFMCLGSNLVFRKYFLNVNKPYFLNTKLLPKHINKNIAVCLHFSFSIFAMFWYTFCDYT